MRKRHYISCVSSTVTLAALLVLIIGLETQVNMCDNLVPLDVQTFASLIEGQQQCLARSPSLLVASFTRLFGWRGDVFALAPYRPRSVDWLWRVRVR